VNCIECKEEVALAVHNGDKGHWVGYECGCGWHWRRSEHFRLEREAELELAVMLRERNGWEMTNGATG